MTQGERIKEIRKALGFTLEKFGMQLGVTKATISRLETGERSCTEHMAKLISREFNVNYIWLTTGIGEMFTDDIMGVVKSVETIMSGENEFHKNLFRTFARLSESELIALESVFSKFLEAKTEFSNTLQEPYNSSSDEPTIEEKLESYRHELTLQEQAETESKVLLIGKEKRA